MTIDQLANHPAITLAVGQAVDIDFGGQAAAYYEPRITSMGIADIGKASRRAGRDLLTITAVGVGATFALLTPTRDDIDPITLVLTVTPYQAPSPENRAS